MKIQEEIDTLRKSLDNYKADIALLDAAHDALRAIEVVVTHPPEGEKISFYKNNNIWLTTFKLNSDEDLKKAFEVPLHPTSFNFCPNVIQTTDNLSESTNDFNATPPNPLELIQNDQPNQFPKWFKIATLILLAAIVLIPIFQSQNKQKY